jgi:hypothetical protein
MEYYSNKTAFPGRFGQRSTANQQFVGRKGAYLGTPLFISPASLKPE